ncbi:hypothetical protein HMPREF9946_02608 [Acetobacteraceae bacterium AT-5844]|nr:hypothetical protein HMPREF9946_02608 [Acetobacteraceae bacterium AT-5844]
MEMGDLPGKEAVSARAFCGPLFTAECLAFVMAGQGALCLSLISSPR